MPLLCQVLGLSTCKCQRWLTSGTESHRRGSRQCSLWWVAAFYSSAGFYLSNNKSIIIINNNKSIIIINIFIHDKPYEIYIHRSISSLAIIGHPGFLCSCSSIIKNINVQNIHTYILFRTLLVLGGLSIASCLSLQAVKLQPTIIFIDEIGKLVLV